MNLQGFNYNPGYYPTVPNLTYPTYFPQQQTYTSPQPATPNEQLAPQTGQGNVSIAGRVISDPNSIAPQEVPMDGRVSVFPMSDNSAIFVKRWNANGTIETIRFVPEASKPDAVPKSTVTLEDISQELAEVRSDLNKVLKAKPTRTAKGDGSNA